MATRIGDRRLLIAGVRPEHFEDSTLVDEAKRARGITFEAPVDVTEWLGSEQFAFIPYDAPPESAAQLAELATELDSEQLRTQIVASLDPMSRVCPASARAVGQPCPHAPVRPAHRGEPHEARHGRPGARRSDVRPGGRREQLTTKRPRPGGRGRGAPPSDVGLRPLAAARLMPHGVPSLDRGTWRCRPPTSSAHVFCRCIRRRVGASDRAEAVGEGGTRPPLPGAGEGTGAAAVRGSRRRPRARARGRGVAAAPR